MGDGLDRNHRIHSRSAGERGASPSGILVGWLQDDTGFGSFHGRSAEQAVHCVKKEKKQDEIEDAAFWPRRAASDPTGPGERRAGKMAGENHAAVWNGIEKRLAEIETGVHAHGEPKASGAPQRETPEEAGPYDSRDAGQGFSWVRYVYCAAGQKPKPCASVNWTYPRNSNSSYKPTTRKNTAQKMNQRRSCAAFISTIEPKY